MEKENPWLPMYRPKINISGNSITECVRSLKNEKEMTLLDFET